MDQKNDVFVFRFCFCIVVIHRRVSELGILLFSVSWW